MPIVVIAHNIRSTYNVGSILRTCDGFGIKKLYTTGYTPYPTLPNDTRLPHLRDKITRQISKTALGAEKTVDIEHFDLPDKILFQYKQLGYTAVALEQSDSSINLPAYEPPRNIVLLLGEEVHGITPDLLRLCDATLEIPMFGDKESFNVSVATGIALYALNTKILAKNT